MSQSYVLEVIVVSHEPGHWSFSENTDLSETLLVARKLGEQEREAGARVTCVNLWRNPRNALEALSAARILINGTAPDLETGQGSLQIAESEVKFGEAVAVPWRQLRKDLWTFPCAYAQSELVRAFYGLREGSLYIPGEGVSGELPLCALGTFAELGPDPRDVYDAFELAKGSTAYPALWGHDPDVVNTMRQKATEYLEPLPKARPGRPLRKLSDVWPKAGRVLIAQRPRLNTKKLAAVRLDRKALGDVWWPVVLAGGDGDTTEAEKALVVWLNSTLGLLLLLGHREETQGSWVQFKKPVLGRLPVLDVWKIGAGRRERLAKLFDELGKRKLLTYPQMSADPTRGEIDEGIVEILGVREFGILRQLLAREPVICGEMNRLEHGD